MATITHHDALHFTQGTIDVSSTDKFLSLYPSAGRTELKHVAVFEENDVFFLDYSQSRSPLLVSMKLTMLAMHRHQESWSHSFQKNLQFVLAGVARHVNQGHRTINDARASAV